MRAPIPVKGNLVTTVHRRQTKQLLVARISSRQDDIGSVSTYRLINRRVNRTGQVHVRAVVRTERGGGQVIRIFNRHRETLGSGVTGQERIDFATEYKSREKSLSEAQKSRAKKLIHKVVSKLPYICEDCHQKENPLLPLEAIGYSKERIDSITSTEVVGMIKNYTKFYMPKMLQPGAAKKQ